jgi:hypothetical protein
MKVQWRGKDYTFNPMTLEAGQDKPRQSDVDANIYAFDTESVDLGDRYEPICFQMSSSTTGEVIQYLPENVRALHHFIDYFVKTYSWTEFDNHVAFMYGHNLMYDWLQLVKHYPDLLSMARTGVGLAEDYTISEGEYFVKLLKNGLFTGNAPHFTLRIGFSKREYVDLKFRDTFSFFPSALAKLAKTLNFADRKMERAEDLGKRDFRKEGMSEDKKYFEEYSKLDARITRLVGEQIRTLHHTAGMQRLRVSAPGFAINYLMHSIPEGTKLLTGTKDVPTMQLILDTYAGGRTGGVYHGKVDNISVLDFHSSYPASMVSLPSFLPTMDYIKHPSPETIETEELLEIINECHCFMRVSGEETDAKYPAIITSKNNKLTPIFGAFENQATTGVEICVGLKSGTLKLHKVHELVMLVEMEPPAILPFKEFALSAYTRKSTAAKDSPEYTSAKLVLNSAYGKLIESRTETFVADDVKSLVFPFIDGMETEFGKMYYSEYITAQGESKDFNKYYPELVEKVLNQFPEEDSFTYGTFGKLSLTELVYGRYAIPAAASLITATSRARLLSVMKITDALYWDTDSVFIRDYKSENINDLLKTATAWIPEFVLPLSVGDELGELDCELDKASGYLAGTKRYYLSNEAGKVKRAVHGIPTAPFHEAAQMIEKLATGSNNIYTGRARPTGVKETKDKNIIGRFSAKEYESQFRLDDRLDWEETPGGWIGNYKNVSRETLKEEKK